MNIREALGIFGAKAPDIIAVVGSGGKTSLIGALAREGSAQQLRVAVLPTTQMWKTPDFREEFVEMPKGSVTVFGKSCGNGKITYPGDECYEKVCRHADLVLLEADGSKGLPVKFSGAQEPVIPGNVNRILCVCGMSGLGKKGQSFCHRWELAVQKGIAKEQELLTEDLLVKLLEEGYGRPLSERYPYADFSYCMNQAEGLELKEAAARVLSQTGRKGVVLSLFHQKNILYEKREALEYKIAMIYLAAGFSRRYGRNKLLEQIGEAPMYFYGLQTLKQAAEKIKRTAQEGSFREMRMELVAVSQYPEILTGAAALGYQTRYNPHSEEGITASIRMGLAAAPEADAYLFAVADQPWLKPDSVVGLIEGFMDSEKTIACLWDGVRNGNPVIFSSRYKEALGSLTGDRGGAVLLKQYPEEVLRVLAAKKELQDVDVPKEAGNEHVQ